MYLYKGCSFSLIMIIFSFHEARALLGAVQQGKQVMTIPINLGKEKQEVILTEKECLFSDHQHLVWEEITRISETENACFPSSPTK